MNSGKYIVWGTGWEAEQFFYQYHNKIEIIYFVDKFNYNRKFYGIDVKCPDKLRGGKILIASSAYYGEIKKQLIEMGFEEYRDFTYCFNVDKKIAFINGNCHCDIIKSYLCTSKEFAKKYVFGAFPLIHENKAYDEKVLEYCDLFIYQDIRKESSVDYKYSEEYMLPRLKEECVKICVPNLYGFPKALFYKNHMLSECGHKVSGGRYNPFLYCEEIIDECIQHGESFEKICTRLKEEFVEEREIIARFRKDREIILEREKGWDVKISDYIFENYQTTQLFYDVAHPTNFLLKEISNRILVNLGIEGKVSDDIKGSLNCYEVPVYDCIKDALGIQWSNSFLRERMENTASFVLTETKMDWREYVKEYIWWRYGKEAV